MPGINGKLCLDRSFSAVTVSVGAVRWPPNVTGPSLSSVCRCGLEWISSPGTRFAPLCIEVPSGLFFLRSVSARSNRRGLRGEEMAFFPEVPSTSVLAPITAFGPSVVRGDFPSCFLPWRCRCPFCNPVSSSKRAALCRDASIVFGLCFSFSFLFLIEGPWVRWFPPIFLSYKSLSCRLCALRLSAPAE